MEKDSKEVKIVDEKSKIDSKTESQTLVWSAAKIKAAFLEYFQNQNHTFVNESSLLPPSEDKSLLFTNSGMVQFKKILCGDEKAKFSRVCNVQRCVRTGGKHNDFHQTGKDGYHHTMFEMYGSWSFPNSENSDSINHDSINHDSHHSTTSYGKAEAIKMAWNLLINVFKLDKDRIYVTYYSNNLKHKEDQVLVPDDEETRDIWKQYLDSSRILPFGAKENFWEMGNTGPCGPCTEIHYDLQNLQNSHFGPRFVPALVNKDDPSVVELWNLVFMQYQRHSDSSLTNLPSVSIDTGGGFERLVCALQNKSNNYETDLFSPYYDIIRSKLKVLPTLSPETEMSYRILVDHIRTMIHLLYDEVLPGKHTSNQSAVWVKLFKRAYHSACQHLGMKRGMFTNIVEEFLDVQIQIYPFLAIKRRFILYVFFAEERNFGAGIFKAVPRFKTLMQNVVDNKKMISQKEMIHLTKNCGIDESLIQLFAADMEFTIIN